MNEEINNKGIKLVNIGITAQIKDFPKKSLQSINSYIYYQEMNHMVFRSSLYSRGSVVTSPVTPCTREFNCVDYSVKGLKYCYPKTRNLSAFEYV